MCNLNIFFDVNKKVNTQLYIVHIFVWNVITAQENKLMRTINFLINTPNNFEISG